MSLSSTLAECARSLLANGNGPGACIVAACGAGWGISQVFFGLAVDAVGIALAFSVILGIAAAVGGVVPLLRDHPDKIFSAGGLGVLAGLALVIIGVGICAVAGRRREKALGLGPQAGKASVGMGLLFCLFSGLGSALVGIGLDNGQTAGGREHRASRKSDLGADGGVASADGGRRHSKSYLLFVSDCARIKPDTNSLLPSTGGYWLLAFVMAICWFGSTLMYGIVERYVRIVGHHARVADVHVTDRDHRKHSRHSHRRMEKYRHRLHSEFSWAAWPC